MRFFAFWGFIKMNILIVGNGFDLSHYLPTKYDHFMDVMGAIENWDVSKGEMNFDDLFGALYEKESYFFGYTKAMYKTDEIKISVDQIKDLLCTLRCLEVFGIFTARTLVRGFRRSFFPVAINQLKVIHGTHRLY